MTERLRSDRGDYHLLASNAIDTRGSDAGNFSIPSKQEISDKKQSWCRRTNPLLSFNASLSIYIGREAGESEKEQGGEESFGNKGM